MKTTIELPEELVKQVKLRAIHDGRKLKDTVADLLRRGLEAPKEPIRTERQSPVTFQKNTGLPLIPCRSAQPYEEMTPDRVVDILVEQEAEWHRDAR